MIEWNILWLKVFDLPLINEAVTKMFHLIEDLDKAMSTQLTIVNNKLAEMKRSVAIAKCKLKATTENMGILICT